MTNSHVRADTPAYLISILFLSSETTHMSSMFDELNDPDRGCNSNLTGLVRSDCLFVSRTTMASFA